MPYVVTEEIRRRAQQLGVTVKSSANKNKKLDVFQDGKKIASIGAAGMMDFHLWKKEKGDKYAQERRLLYHNRHPYNLKKVNGKWTADYLSKFILW